MGRKTDKFINDIDKLITACRSLEHQLTDDRKEIAQLRKKIKDMGKVLENAYKIRAPVENLQALHKLFEKFTRDRTQMVTKIEQTGAQLRRTYYAAEAEVIKFQKFIEQKRRLKNPFKKKSLGRAEAFIDHAKQYLRHVEGLVEQLIKVA